MSAPVLSLVLAAGTALLVALIVTPLLRRLAIRVGLVDDPGLRKVHKQPIANVGGIAILASLFAGFGALLLLEPVVATQLFASPEQGLAVLVALVAICLVGLTDDIINLRVRHKALAQILIATGLYIAGVRLDAIQVTGNVPLELGMFSYPLTVLWIVGVTNAFNLIDGLDGLAAGIATMVCAALAILGIEYGQYLLAGMALCMAASLVGFLVYNRHPARIYLGDCGSLTLGLFVATGSLLSLQANNLLASPRYISFALPLLAAAVPLLDCLHCMLRRTLERRSPFAADKGHIHHLLISLGIPHGRAVLMLHAVTLVATTLGIMALYQGGVPRMLLLIAGMLSVAAFFWAVGYFSFRNILTNLRQVRNIAREDKLAQRSYEDLRLEMREAKTFDQWWSTLCHAAEALSFGSVSLDIQSRESGPRTLSWKAPESHKGIPLTLQAPVPQRRRNEPLQAIVTIDPTLGGLELCAARFRLFARLLDEHNLLTLTRQKRARPAPHLAHPEQAPTTINIASTA